MTCCDLFASEGHSVHNNARLVWGAVLRNQGVQDSRVLVLYKPFALNPCHRHHRQPVGSASCSLVIAMVPSVQVTDEKSRKEESPSFSLFTMP